MFWLMAQSGGEKQVLRIEWVFAKAEMDYKFLVAVHRLEELKKDHKITANMNI